jgi:hypothetical protein
VQQPCSNPSECPEILGKPLSQKYRYLQPFWNYRKSLENYRTDFTRQRSLVRTQHRPLENAYLQVQREEDEGTETCAFSGETQIGD